MQKFFCVWLRLRNADLNSFGIALKEEVLLFVLSIDNFVAFIELTGTIFKHFKAFHFQR
jgi:hypothetical protein